MEEILYKLLEQTPVVIALGVGIWAIWKDKSKVSKEWKTDREKHAEELKELNGYVREREKQHIDTLKSLITIIETVEENQKKLLNQHEEIKSFLIKNG